MTHFYGDPVPQQPKSKTIAQSQIELCNEREAQILLILEHPGGEAQTQELQSELGHLRALRAENERLLAGPSADPTQAERDRPMCRRRRARWVTSYSWCKQAPKATSTAPSPALRHIAWTGCSFRSTRS
jgi:hypothetical protein